MKSLAKILFLVLIAIACSRTSEKAEHESEAADSVNQALYKEVMKVHDEIMPNMEKIYDLKKDLEDRIANTPNLSKAQTGQVQDVISNLDTANYSMVTWMQKFSPLADSIDRLKAREYLEAELQKVKKVRDDVNGSIAQAEAELSREYKPVSKNTKVTKVEVKETKPTAPVVKPAPVKEELVETKVIEPIVKEIPKKDSVVVKRVAVIDSSANKKSVVKPAEKLPDGKPFYFKLVNAETGKPVSGEVHIVEAKATQYLGFKGNQLVYIVPPKNIAGIYQASIEAPGYKPAKLVFDYKAPEALSSEIGEKKEVIFTFELVKAKRGDYIDFNDVRFFRNTTILEPQSQDELNSLADLMKEDQSKIRIHGHCNGDKPRTVTVMGTSTNIFALDATHNKKEMLTAKQFTELRAEVVKNYLVSQGIDADRISTKGEGGKMMIYPASSTLANRNDRVEIEVLKKM